MAAKKKPAFAGKKAPAFTKKTAKDGQTKQRATTTSRKAKGGSGAGMTGPY